jgi:hypothetical protein
LNLNHSRVVKILVTWSSSPASTGDAEVSSQSHGRSSSNSALAITHRAVPQEPGLGSFVFFSEDFEMSEYVEARYAKLVLREARGADEAEAARLVHDLLRDLAPPRASNVARAQALTSIRVLALSLDEPQSRHVREWEAADRATEAWCSNAYL